MVAVEAFSKYLVAVPIPNKESATVAYAFLHNVLSVVSHAAGAALLLLLDRCGMTIPHETATNPSVWGTRTWVPHSILAAADGRPSPELMHCLRVDLNKQLKDSQGSMNRMVGQQTAACTAVLWPLSVGLVV